MEEVIDKSVALTGIFLAFVIGLVVGLGLSAEQTPDSWPAWVDTVCLEGRGHWDSTAHRECHVIKLPEKEQN